MAQTGKSPWQVPGGKRRDLTQGEMNILLCKHFVRETRQAGRKFCQQRMRVRR